MNPEGFPLAVKLDLVRSSGVSPRQCIPGLGRGSPNFPNQPNHLPLATRRLKSHPAPLTFSGVLPSYSLVLFDAYFVAMGVLECLTGGGGGRNPLLGYGGRSGLPVTLCGDVIHVLQMAMLLHAWGDETRGLKLPLSFLSRRK